MSPLTSYDFGNCSNESITIKKKELTTFFAYINKLSQCVAKRKNIKNITLINLKLIKLSNE